MRVVLALAFFALAPLAHAQYEPTEPIYPVTECIGQKDDGTFYAWMGYVNANIFRDADGSIALGADGNPISVEIPIGADNEHSRQEDLGQPTTFKPGNNRYAYRIEYRTNQNGRWYLRVPGQSRRRSARYSPQTFGDCVYESFADVELSFQLDDPLPQVGVPTEGTLTLTNQGTIPATTVHVQRHLPEGVALALAPSASGAPNPSVGGMDFDGHWWTVDELAPGQSVTLRVLLSAETEMTASGFFDVECEDQDDIDSRPANMNPQEDDYAPFSFTTIGASAGGEGGLESNGNLATLLARREVTRRIDTAQRERLGLAAPALVPLAQSDVASAKGSALDLRSLFPASGPGASTPFVSTPEDLLGVTNATSILAADYMQANGDRVGAILALLTPSGETYDHTKAICDRVKGSRLESVRTVDADGARYILLHITRPDGSVDYAISFVAYREGEGYTTDSRFRADEYQIASGGSEVLNVQAWASTPEAAHVLARDLIRRLDAQFPLERRNWGTTMPTVPSVFVRAGQYTPGALLLDIANTTDEAVVLDLAGRRALLEDGARSPFTASVTVPASGVQAELPVDPLFDVDLTLRASGVAVDNLYLADGAWTFASADESDALTYALNTSAISPEASVRPVERNASLSGTRSQWAGLFRTLLPGSQPVDLGAYGSLVFEARGTGRVQVLVETASGDPYIGWVNLTSDARTVALPFTSLRRPDDSGGFAGEEVVGLSFYSYGSGTPEAFELDIRSVRFAGADFVSTEEVEPLALALAVTPNPSQGRATVRFTTPEAGTVRVDVIDLLGRRVATITDGSFSQGEHTLALPQTMAAGTYIVRLQVGSEVAVTRITRVR